ncbi:hypothetical protein [Metabacillus litoralis]|nr:hypothetical protein [Metabacillus litoralis]
MEDILKQILSELKDIKTDVGVLKTDVRDLNADVGALKTDVVDLKQDKKG